MSSLRKKLIRLAYTTDHKTLKTCVLDLLKTSAVEGRHPDFDKMKPHWVLDTPHKVKKYLNLRYPSLVVNLNKRTGEIETMQPLPMEFEQTEEGFWVETRHGSNALQSVRDFNKYLDLVDSRKKEQWDAIRPAPPAPGPGWGSKKTW